MLTSLTAPAVQWHLSHALLAVASVFAHGCGMHALGTGGI
jgi:hypothetical protein